jgi:hypothetical protein
VTFALGGVLSRRVRFNSSLGASISSLGLTDEGSAGRGLRSYYGTAGISFALARTLAMRVDYQAYVYEFDNIDLLPVPPSSRVYRQSVRANVDVWVPLFTRGRR